MDEISVFTELRPANPANAEQIRLRAGRRLAQALAKAPPANSGRPARAPRPRLRAAALAAAAVVVVSAAVAVPAVLPGGAGPLTRAWAVQRNPDGTIKVTLTMAFHDQAALQRALRADGIPAYVRSLMRCATWVPRGGLRYFINDDDNAIILPGGAKVDRAVFVIHPHAIPEGYAVFIAAAQARTWLAVQYGLMSRPPVCDTSVHNPTPFSPAPATG